MSVCPRLLFCNSTHVELQPAITQALAQGRSVDARRFPHHTEVRQYLEAFADRYELRDAVHLNTRVTRVAPTPPSDGGGTTWQVDTVSAGRGTAAQGAPELGAAETREYDAVVICSGHYTVPRMPDIEGLDSFPGRVEHSHMYRRPEVYSGQRVLIVGAFATGAALQRLMVCRKCIRLGNKNSLCCGDEAARQRARAAW